MDTNTEDKLEAAEKLLSSDSISLDNAHAALELVKGINSRLDRLVTASKKALEVVSKVQKGELIELSVEAIPAETEEEKKRKKTLLLFIKTFKDLKNEVQRAKTELESAKGRSAQDQVTTIGKLATFAKGPLGLVTIAAVIIAAVSIYWAAAGPKTDQTVQQPEISAQNSATKIQVISFNSKKIPLTELEVRTGPDCTANGQQIPHYHAKNHQSVTATDGSVIQDPGSCAFGKASEVKIEEI